MNGSVRLLADTQIVIWYVTDPGRLTSTAIRAIEGATERDEAVGVLAFALVEMIYAVEKATNPLTAEDLEAIVRVLADPESPFEVIPIDAAIAERVRSVPRQPSADPGDRLVVAAAEVLGASLITADRQVPAMTATPVIW